jgi:hypothetical protein
MEWFVTTLNDFLYGSYYQGYRSECNASSATFEVDWFEPNEYAHAQEEIHRVFGVCIMGMAVLWFGHILKRVDKSFVLVWSGRAQQFMGWFLFLWLLCLMSPRNFGSRLFQYVQNDWQQIQHINLAFIFLAAGTSETISGLIMIKDKKRRRRRRKIKSERRVSLLLCLHIAWTCHLFTAGILFLFHPQAHQSHLAMHRVLGVAVSLGALSTGFSKCLETIKNDGETLKYYWTMLLPKVCWIAVIQLLLFFPHHGAQVHKGFHGYCQPPWLRHFVILAGVFAFVSLISTNSLWYFCLSRRHVSNGNHHVEYQLVQSNNGNRKDDDDDDDVSLSSSDSSDCDDFPFMERRRVVNNSGTTFMHNGEIWRRS